MQQIPVYVISLERAVGRRNAVRAHLDSLGIDYTLVDAVDGGTLSDEYVSELVAPNANWHRGVVGCYLSHLRAYESLVASAENVTLVLEDDGRLSGNAVRLLEHGLDTTEFDYCFLDSDPHNLQGPVFYDAGSPAALAPGILAYPLSAGPQTLHAYLITRNGAAKRLAHAFPIVQPIDIYHHLPYEIRFWAVVAPKLAWVSEHSLQSFTSDRNDDVTSLRFSALRKSPLFYDFVELLKLRRYRANRQIRKLLTSGKLQEGKRWTALPAGRNVVLR